MTELSQATQKLISLYQTWYQSLQPKPGVSTIHVDEIASKVAAFYEKIRGIIDWQEEHLLRRRAIARMFKRKIMSAEGPFAETLILELIRGGHFPNDRIEEFKIEKVQGIIDKYVFILNNKPEREIFDIQFQNWLSEIAACEIEEALEPSIRERALISFMFEKIKERLKINEGIIKIGGISEQEKNIQIYIAVQRSLFKMDSPIISYHLLKYIYYPEWSNPSQNQLQEITNNIYSIRNKIEKDLKHYLSDKFYKVCEKYDTPYLLIGDILSEGNPAEIAKKISEPEVFESLIEKVYNKRLSTLKARLYRAALYSTLSIFLTNSFSLYFLEVPLAKLITGTFTPLTILVDILGPTFLMLILVITIKPPSKNNLTLVKMETMKITYRRETQDFYEIKSSRRRGVLTMFFIVLIYLLGAGVSFGIVAWVFQLAKFPPTSVIINIMFIALIAFAGSAIRKRSAELTVEEKPGGLSGFIVDIFFLPVAGLGKLLSNKWKKYNAIAIFFSALIDMPFYIFVEFLDQWRSFLKEKKEGID